MNTSLPSASSLPRPNDGVSAVPLVAWVIAGCCLLSFTLRASLPAYVIGDSAQHPLLLAELGGLAIAAAYAMLGDGLKARPLILLIMAATGASLIWCEDRGFAGVRWIGWCTLVSSLGPLSRSLNARRMREVAWRFARHIVVFITVASALWAIAGLPNLGRGDFTGIMWHSMVLGPIVGLAGVLAAVRISENPKPAWIALYLAAACVGLLASSRSALVAMALGTLIVFVMRLGRYPVASFAVIAIGTSIAVTPGLLDTVAGGALPGGLTSGLARKSLVHSRELHWEARWDEFLDSPWTGVGFSYGWLDTIGVSESGSVETGSSYLAILSMTGLFGVAGCVCLPIVAGVRYLRNKRGMPTRIRTEIASFAGFWFVHLGAEGYVYAVGSLMGLLFWLWVGRLFDLLDVSEANARVVPSTPQRTQRPAERLLVSNRKRQAA